MAQPSPNDEPPPDDPPSHRPLNDIPPNNEPHPGTLPLRSLSPPDLDPNPESEDEEPEIHGPGIGTGRPHLLDAQKLTAHLDNLKDTVVATN